MLFVGPSASGKTTVAEAWAETRDRPTAFFDHDHARFLRRAGYVSRMAAHADPSLRDEADRQWLVAASVCESMAEVYTSAGIDFSLAAFRPPGRWKGCWERLDSMDPVIILLLPTDETLFARDAKREGRSHVGEETIRRNLLWSWSDWRSDARVLTIDSSDLSVEETVARVEEEFARRLER